MTQIFISYRRGDSADMAGRIYDRLVLKYGEDHVSLDVESFPLGIDFREVIKDKVGRCCVLLAVIGAKWLGASGPTGGRRLDEPDDHVRLEIEAALRRGIPVIPILVSGAVMPSQQELPSPLQELTFRTGIAVRGNPDFHNDMARLVKGLDPWLPRRPGIGRWALARLARLMRRRESVDAAEPDGQRSSAVDAPSDEPVTILHPGQLREGEALPPEVVNSLHMKCILVHPGNFWMGHRGSQIQVAVGQAFYMAAHPVTQGQWQAVMGGNPSCFSRKGSAAERMKGLSDADLTWFPVEQVSWEDVQEFLLRLNARARGSGLHYRLPTEVEWEYACRGGANSEPDCAFDFYFGEPTCDLSTGQANFDGSYPAGRAPQGRALGRTTKVGSYQPNRLGLYDMHGNVGEWCEDAVEVGGSARVFRGGSWCGSAATCRASHRDGNDPTLRLDFLGFRIVAVPFSDVSQKRVDEHAFAKRR